MDKKAQYNTSLSGRYAKLVKFDPCKKFVQYPETLRLLGSIKNKSILDIGCGQGHLTRQLAKKGANVIAYDVSKTQIELAKIHEKKEKLGIQYLVSDPYEIEDKLTKRIDLTISIFDKAVSTLVLHYAKDRKHLTKFFSSTYALLKNKGEFVSIFTNPEYKKLNKKRYNRLFIRTKKGMQTDFLDSLDNVIMTIYFSDFSKKDYEYAAKKAGFKKMRWVNIKLTKEGVKKMGKKYWDNFEKDCPYIGFIVRK